jgi:multisubunit Na+/H+ antiporter MnhC subunit
MSVVIGIIIMCAAPPLLGEHSVKGYIDPLPQALI